MFLYLISDIPGQVVSGKSGTGRLNEIGCKEMKYRGREKILRSEYQIKIERGVLKLVGYKKCGRGSKSNEF